MLVTGLAAAAFWSVRAGPLQAWRIDRDLRQAVVQWERAGAPLDRLPHMTDGAPERDVAFVGASRHLLVTVGVGPCDEGLQVRAVESDHGVALLAHARPGRGSCTSQLVFTTVPVTLSRPVGQRQVFNGSSGQALQRTDAPVPAAAGWHTSVA